MVTIVTIRAEYSTHLFLPITTLYPFSQYFPIHIYDQFLRRINNEQLLSL